MTRIVFAGRAKLRIPDGWTRFRWQGRHYRLAGPIVETYDADRRTWRPSLLLTTAAPKGRAA